MVVIGKTGAVSFVDAARKLIQALLASNDDEYRLALLKRVVKRLGDGGYPHFLKLLLTVAESSDQRAKRLVAETLALGLKKMDLPGGELTSWGASSFSAQNETAINASLLSGMVLAGAPKRSFGPIEYLTVWYGQSTQRRRLSLDTYQRSLQQLIELLQHSPIANKLYPVKLEADARNELEGAYTRTTRERMLLIAKAWTEKLAPAEIAKLASLPN
jgi:hypothetical protein